MHDDGRYRILLYCVHVIALRVKQWEFADVGNGLDCMESTAFAGGLRKSAWPDVGGYPVI